jgi:hypothetical protein
MTKITGTIEVKTHYTNEANKNVGEAVDKVKPMFCKSWWYLKHVTTVSAGPKTVK